MQGIFDNKNGNFEFDFFTEFYLFYSFLREKILLLLHIKKAVPKNETSIPCVRLLLFLLHFFEHFFVGHQHAFVHLIAHLCQNLFIG